LRFLKEEIALDKIEQISIFAENEPGKIERITKVLSNHRINIRTITIASADGYGIIKLLVNDPQKAYRILEKEGFSVALNQVLAIEMEDKPGGFYRVAKVLREQKINVEDAYGFVIESGKKAVLIMRIKEIEKAKTLLRKENIPLLSKKALYKL